MHELRWVFTILTMCGCFRPSSWTTPAKKFLYNSYTVVLLLITHTLMLSQILDVVFNVENQDDFSENFYLTLGIFISCCKMCNLLRHRGDYANLINTLQEEPLLPVNTDEIEIRTRFDKLAEWNAIGYAILVETCILWMIATSAFTAFRQRKLTYRVWLPYDYTSSVAFTITYAHQAATLMICSLFNVGCDTLFSGLLIHTYCQFEILGHRLKRIITNKNDTAKQCARLHHHIYRFAAMVNEGFKTVVFVQFLGSTSVLCFDLYRLAKKDLGSRFAETVLYAICTLMQILYYCWYGNEVTLKSLEIPDMIIESNWSSLDNGAKKILLMIMRRATVPIKFSSVYLVSMDLNSFKNLVKTSYSAFNMLQQS